MERRDFSYLTLGLAHFRAGGRCECPGGCGSCNVGQRCSADITSGAFEADHIVTRNDNGLDNLRLLCQKCHQAKTMYAQALALLFPGGQTATTTAYANAAIELSRQGTHSAATLENPTGASGAYIAAILSALEPRA